MCPGKKVFKIIQLKHSTGPNTLDYWEWHNETMYPPYDVAASAYCSHVRSAGEDSSAVVWLAFYNDTETQIKLAHSTGQSPHEAWDDTTIVYNAQPGYEQVMNPSLIIDELDIFHICYTRFNTNTGKYQLVYVSDDSSFDNPTEQIIVESDTPINDGHISLGAKFGHVITIFSYENNSSIYLVTLIDGAPLGAPEEVDSNVDDIDPDSILDADQCDLHMVWSTKDIPDRQLARRNGVLVED